MYVWYGTNEFNFETLRNPPHFKPTLCAKCKQQIHLGTESHTRSGGDYYCERCVAIVR
jgi:hypothetical protein